MRATSATGVGVDASAAARAAEEAMLAELLGGIPEQPSRPEPKKPEPKKPEPKKPEPKKPEPEEPSVAPPREPVQPTPKPITELPAEFTSAIAAMSPEERAAVRDAARGQYATTRAAADEAWSGDDSGKRDPEAVRAHVQATSRVGTALSLAADATYHDELEKKGLTDAAVQEQYDAAKAVSMSEANKVLARAHADRVWLRRQAYQAEVALLRGETETATVTPKVELTRTFAEGTDMRGALDFGISAYPKSMMDEALGSLGRLRTQKNDGKSPPHFSEQKVFTGRAKVDRLYFDARGRMAAAKTADLATEAHPGLAFDSREKAQEAVAAARRNLDRNSIGRAMPDPEVIETSPGRFLVATPREKMRQSVPNVITDVAPAINLNDRPDTAVHEFAHVVEYHNDRIGAACKQFIYDRTDGLTKQSYMGDRNAQVAEDGFVSAYSSRDYPQDRNSTEVFSTGMQALYGGATGGLVNEGPVGSMRKFRSDYEHRALVLGLLATA